MSDGPRDDRSSAEPPIGPAEAGSAPWERPGRWNNRQLEPTRVDDLLAKVGTPADPVDGRRRRRADEPNDPDSISAGALIAALQADNSGSDGPEVADPNPMPVPEHDPDPDPDPDPDRARRPVLNSSEGRPPRAIAPDATDAVSHRVPSNQSDRIPDTAAALISGQPGGRPTWSVPAGSAASASLAGPFAPPGAGDDATVLLTHGKPTDSQPGRSAPGQVTGSSDQDHTVIIPKFTDASELGQAYSIRQSLSRQSISRASAPPVVGPPAGPPVVDPPRPTSTGPTPPPHRKRHRAWFYAGRSLVVLVAVVALIEFGSYWRILRNTSEGLQQNKVTALDPGDANIVTATTGATKVTGSGGSGQTSAAAAVAPKVYPVENILLLGSDSRADGNGDAGDSNSTTDDTANADTMMLAHISADRQHVTIMSLPRDTIIPAPTCNTWDFKTRQVSSNVETGGQRSHLNSAYAVGGPACTVKAVQELTGIQVTRFIEINFEGFKGMVDALGGITVDVCRPIIDNELGTVEASAGVQLIQGTNALNLVRARDVQGDTQSDLARIHRQQVVLSTILRQVTQAGTLLNQNKLSGFLKSFTSNTFTDNVSVDDLVNLAGELGDLSPSRVTFYTLPTVPSKITPGALEVDETDAKPLFNDLINDLPLPGEVTATPKTTATTSKRTTAAPRSQSLELSVNPAQVNLQIYNETGLAGVAGKAEAALNAIGFVVTDKDLVKPTTTQTAITVEYSGNNRAAALTVASAVPGSQLAIAPGLGTSVRLILGSSYTGKVSPVIVGQVAPDSLSTQISTTAQAASTTRGASTTSSTTVSASSVNAGTANCV